MRIEVKVPQLPESVTEATLVNWHKKAGEPVKRDENLIDVETDKVVLELPAPNDGVLIEITREDGATVTSNDVIGVIDTEAKGAQQPAAAKSQPTSPVPAAKPTAPPAQPSTPVAKPSVRPPPVSLPSTLGSRPEQRVPMSRLRQRVAERLVQSQSTAAILTTFKEVNMGPVIELRNRYKERFEKEHV